MGPCNDKNSYYINELIILKIQLTKLIVNDRTTNIINRHFNNSLANLADKSSIRSINISEKHYSFSSWQ